MTQMPNVKQFVYSDINYAFERSKYLRNSDGDYYEVPIIVGEIVDPNYLV